MNSLTGAFRYLSKVFDLPSLLGPVRDTRVYPVIPTRCIHLSLLLGAFLRVPSLLALSHRTRRPGWRRIVGFGQVSADSFGYALRRAVIDDWRQVLVAVNKRLKENKRLEEAKIGGLLVIAIDANEQFRSRARCCEQCCQRTVTLKDATGLEREEIEYYHRQVYAHITGPEFCTVLDLEPIRPGEEEATAALRMLGRMRRMYGVRFFDAVTLDAWYTKGPCLRAVEKLGWGWVSVLKQERFDIYKESTALALNQKSQSWEKSGRKIELREVRDLDFTDPELGKVRVVMTDEHWIEARIRGGKAIKEPMSSHWRWMVSGKLDPMAGPHIVQMGHQRWGIENHTFNELTQHHDLEHCACHDPTANLAWILIRVIGFVLFELYAKVYRKSVRLGMQTLADLCEELRESLGRWEELEPLWSG